MPDPVTAGGIVVLSDLWTRGLNAILDESSKKLDDLKASAARIEQAINGQNQAQLSAARLALLDGDLEQASNGLRLSVSLDPLNAATWGLYAECMLRRGNIARAQSIYEEALETFGGNTPHVPLSIRQAYLQNGTINFDGGIHYTKTCIEYSKVTCLGASKSGITVQKENPESGGDISVSAWFRPWATPKSFILHATKSRTIGTHGQISNPYGLGEGFAFRQLYCMTDRYLATVDGSVYDLRFILESDSFPTQLNVPPEKLPDIFGEPGFGIVGFSCVGRAEA